MNRGWLARHDRHLAERSRFRLPWIGFNYRMVKRFVTPAVGLIITGFALWLAFRSYSYREVAEALKAPNYWWLLPNLSLGFLAMLMQALRWRTLLLPLTRVPVKEVFVANSIGLLVNNILPFRLGEYVRILVISQDNRRLTNSSLMATVLLERLVFDLGMLAVIVAVSVVFVPIRGPLNPAIPVIVALGCLIVLVLMIAIAAVRPKTAIALVALLLPFVSVKRCGPFRRSLIDFAEQLSFLRRKVSILRLIFQTILIWVLMAMSVYCLFKSFAFVLPITASVVFLAAVVLAMFLPSLPGHIGTYHLAAVLTLTAYGITNANGRAFAIVIHLLQFIPTTAIGTLFLLRRNLMLGALSRKATESQAGTQ